MASLTDCNAECVDPLLFPPWERSAGWHSTIAKVGYEPGKSKEEAAQAFLRRLKSFPRTYIVVYTDGSQQTDGGRNSAGAGWAGYQADWPIFHGSEPLGPQLQVFDAEAQAAYQGLLHATKTPTARLAGNIHICLDNIAVAARLYTKSIGSSQARFEAFSKLSSS